MVAAGGDSHLHGSSGGHPSGEDWGSAQHLHLEVREGEGEAVTGESLLGGGESVFSGVACRGTFTSGCLCSTILMTSSTTM